MPQSNDYWGIQGSSGSIPSAAATHLMWPHQVLTAEVSEVGGETEVNLSPNFWYRSGKVGNTVTELYKVSKSFSGSWSSYKYTYSLYMMTRCHMNCVENMFILDNICWFCSFGSCN